MIIDLENINCIYCGTKLKLDKRILQRDHYKCDCSKILFKSEDSDHYSVISLIDLHFIFHDEFIDVTRNTLIHYENLYFIILEEINKFDYKNLNSLSEFYNYIKKYFIAYEKNLVFL